MKNHYLAVALNLARSGHWFSSFICFLAIATQLRKSKDIDDGSTGSKRESVFKYQMY